MYHLIIKDFSSIANLNVHMYLCILAMATMSITLANEVLILFNTLSAKYTDKLAAHTNFGEDKSVRVYFLHLFLAFFSHGYSHLIKLLLGLRSK